MQVKVKICGITERAIAEHCLKRGVDYIGLVFFEKSPRNVSMAKAIDLTQFIREQDPDHKMKIVTLTVNASDALLEDIHQHIQPDYCQCHGDEDEARLRYIDEKIGMKLIKAFKIKEKQDMMDAVQFYKSFPHFLPLFDAKMPPNAPLPGGNGESFDWHLLHIWQESIPFMLSGGLNSDNVQDALFITKAKMLDISSGVETMKGVKSAEKITDFMNKVKNAV